MTLFSRFVTSFIAIGLTLSVCACGQKGKLVIPVKPPAISTPYPTPVAKPEKSPDADSAAKPAAPVEQTKVEAPPNPGSLFESK